MTRPLDDDHLDPEPDRFGRRASLVKAGGLAIVVLAGRALPAAAAVKRANADAVSCVLAPEMTEGPYYIPSEKLRRDITEGMPGTPLVLRLTVVNASTCKPIKGAAVDIWHADAAGAYSGEQSNGTVGRTFMRGIQRTDATGLARFDTVYPGWYMGRAVHIHVKVHVGGSVIHTGQLFFDDALTDVVYRKTPYSARRARDVRNADDSIFQGGGSRSILTVRKKGGGYAGAISMGVRYT
jgi:protocatechuate 3,4-dioxygenase beta subunit